MRRESVKRVFFFIPDPTKSTVKRRLCKQWINNLKNGKLRFETFIFNNSKVVCEDHFTAHSFDRNLVAESLNCIPKKKRLLPTAVPTLVNTPTTVREPKKEKNTGKHCIIGDKKKKRHRYTPNEQMLQLFNLQPISKTYICIKLYQLFLYKIRSNCLKILIYYVCVFGGGGKISFVHLEY